MKQIIYCLLAAVLVFSAGCYSPPVQPSSAPPDGSAASGAGEDETVPEPPPPELHLPEIGAELPVSSFTEIWAYLVAEREHGLKPEFPVSDLVYFGADIDSYGKLIDIPDYRKISSFRGRRHFVAACGGRALTHFVLAEGSAERKALVRDLLEAARPYDGLQIDFENVPSRDGEVFLSFLRELRAGQGDKMFSIALPARTRTLKDDVYDYAKIKPLVDRILVMAYDEHWSTSEPGPIASMGWCRRVAAYAMETIGPEKLIMGLPFYGRSWGNISPNRAYIYSGIEDLKGGNNITEVQRENGIPNFKFQTQLSMTVYYEDEYSLSTRLDMYKRLGVASAGFWRLGQETPAFWPFIELES